MGWAFRGFAVGGRVGHARLPVRTARGEGVGKWQLARWELQTTHLIIGPKLNQGTTGFSPWFHLPEL